jgi:hypothetical protein
MFPLNFWNEAKPVPQSTVSQQPSSSQESFRVMKDQSETQTSSFLKIREILSSDEKQRDVTRHRKQVLGFDNR